METGNGASSSSSNSALEERLRRIEEALRLSPVRERDHRSRRDSQNVGDSVKSETSSEDEVIDPPRFTLGGTEMPVYHGETSMHEDTHSLDVDPSPKTNASSSTANKPSVDATHWTQEDIRGLTRLRHKYATPEEGEVLMDAYFAWASPSTAVVNRRLFLRESEQLVMGAD